MAVSFSDMTHHRKRGGEESGLHAFLVAGIELVAHLDATVKVAAKRCTDDRSQGAAKDKT